MAMRSAIEALSRFSRSPVTVARESAALRSARLFSDGKGKILSEEEKAAENIYIQVSVKPLVFLSASIGVDLCRFGASMQSALPSLNIVWFLLCRNPMTRTDAAMLLQSGLVVMSLEQL
ncbi:hypothetical protein ZIOFF_014792 [Zingiber officinale]|uniref:Uncharacterized protein n=1 Tax=Zingiber officinale TaxID=94328 RepID=A0A8J5LEL0_ZINOF|nr:hypothetical protein ZIOFF_014792 [Zingiber officinale]